MNRLADLQLLRSPVGEKALAFAAEILTDQPPTAQQLTRMRREIPAEIVPLAVTQTRLRRKAVTKWGDVASRLWFTAAGLEMASHPACAKYRAKQLARTGAVVLDLGCGLGMDSQAFAREGADVLAWETDELTAQCAQLNAEALGLPIRVQPQDAMATAWPACHAWFADPARRDATGTRTLRFDSTLPPVPQLLDRRPPGLAGVVKVAPGVSREDLARVPEAGVRFLSVERELKEATLWFDLPARPRELVECLSGETFSGPPGEPTPDPELQLAPGAVLLDPHPGIPRADLLGHLAEQLPAAAFEPGLALLLAPDVRRSPWVRNLRILEVGPWEPKLVQAWLRSYRADRPTLLTRGNRWDPQRWLPGLKPAGERRCWLVATTYQGTPAAILTDPPIEGESGFSPTVTSG